MNDNEVKQTLTKIVASEDIDKALQDKVTYKWVKGILLRMLEGEPIDIKLDKLVKDTQLNQETLYELLDDAHTALLVKLLENGALEEALDKANKDRDLYKELYKELDDEQLVESLHAKAIAKVLDEALDEAFDEALDKAQENQNFYIKSLREELSSANIDYYLEFSKVLDWFSVEYRKYGEETKEFIKKHIDTIVESDNPNEGLEGLLLFQRYQLHKVKLIQKSQDTNDSDVDRYLDEMIKNHYNKHISIVGSFYKLLGPWAKDSFNKFLDMSPEHIKELEQHLLKLEKSSLLTTSEYINTKDVTLKNLNRNNIIAFIENQSSPLKAVTVPPKLHEFDFTFLLTLLKTLFNKNRDSRSFIATIKVSINTVKASRQQYKKYQEELSKVTKIYQDQYKTHMELLVAEILDKEGAVQEGLDFKKVARVLCELSHFYRSDINGLTKKNSAIDKLFEKFNYPNTADPMVMGKLEVLSWIYEGFYGNIDIAGKEFMQQHLDKIMDCDHPREALNALYLIYFYKLHDKASTDTIIDAVLKNASPEVFFKGFLEKLTSMNKRPYLLKKAEINSVLDKLLRPQSLTSDKQVPEIIASEATTVRSINEQPIIKGSITSRSGLYSSSTKDVNDAHKPYGKPVVYRPEVKLDATMDSTIRPVKSLG